MGAEAAGESVGTGMGGMADAGWSHVGGGGTGGGVGDSGTSDGLDDGDGVGPGPVGPAVGTGAVVGEGGHVDELGADPSPSAGNTSKMVTSAHPVHI
mmetsp:Transcript_27006/g.79799  ORF Transcript_27006/g.79799 Transcript_27006/m.79799 type:complete len:97 (-) Transcript_27006:552-842(-)